jgi:phosphoribosylformylglycinamidine synthase PurS subunit
MQEAAETLKARVEVTLKRGVLDPQGEAVRQALGGMGFEGVRGVRVGKVIEIELAGSDRARAEAEIRRMCERLLANTVIEDFRVELV